MWFYVFFTVSCHVFHNFIKDKKIHKSKTLVTRVVSVVCLDRNLENRDLAKLCRTFLIFDLINLTISPSLTLKTDVDLKLITLIIAHLNTRNQWSLPSRTLKPFSGHFCQNSAFQPSFQVSLKRFIVSSGAVCFASRQLILLSFQKPGWKTMETQCCKKYLHTPSLQMALQFCKLSCDIFCLA